MSYRTSRAARVVGMIALVAAARGAHADAPLVAQVVVTGVDLAASVDARWGTDAVFTPGVRAGYTFGDRVVGAAIGGEFRALEAIAFEAPHRRGSVTELRGYARMVIRDGRFAMYAGVAVGATRSPTGAVFHRSIETRPAAAVQIGCALHLAPRSGLEVGAELEGTAYDQDRRVSARVGAFTRF